MSDTPNPNLDLIGYIWDLIQKIRDQIVYANGGMHGQLDRIEANIPAVAAEVTNQVYQSQLYIQDSVAHVNANVDYSRQFVVDRVDKDVGSINASNNETFLALTQQVISGNQAILQSIVNLEGHIDDRFADLENKLTDVVGKLADKLAQAIGDAIQKLIDQESPFLHDIENALSGIKQSFDDLKSVTDTRLGAINDTLKGEFEALVSATKDDTTKHIDELEKVKEYLGDAISQGASKIAGDIAAGTVGIQFAIGANTAAILAGNSEVAAALASGFASEKVIWGPVIAQALALLVGLNGLYDTLIKPMLTDPEGVIAEVMAFLTNMYFNVGEKTYDKLGLDNSTLPKT